MHTRLLITTPRLQLRELTLQDLPALYSYASSSEVARYQYASPWSLEECQQYLDFHVSHQLEEGRTIFSLALVLLTEQLFIGTCSLHIKQLDAREAELGYGLHPLYWGHGYATEATHALLHCAFTQLHLHRVFALCDAANLPSVRVMQKLGMQQEGRLREHKLWHEQWHDSLLYSILATEFKI